MKRSYIVIVFLLGLVATLSIANAVMHNMLSTSGIFVGKAEQEINSYKTQNAILSEELLTASSLTTITEKAEKSGFTNETKLMVIGTSRPLAVNQ